jgi:hypothetical protein
MTRRSIHDSRLNDLETTTNQLRALSKVCVSIGGRATCTRPTLRAR